MRTVKQTTEIYIYTGKTDGNQLRGSERCLIRVCVYACACVSECACVHRPVFQHFPQTNTIANKQKNTRSNSPLAYRGCCSKAHREICFFFILFQKQKSSSYILRYLRCLFLLLMPCLYAPHTRKNKRESALRTACFGHGFIRQMHLQASSAQEKKKKTIHADGMLRPCPNRDFDTTYATRMQTRKKKS
jgi:hypothetical protein